MKRCYWCWSCDCGVARSVSPGDYHYNHLKILSANMGVNYLLSSCHGFSLTILLDPSLGRLPVELTPPTSPSPSPLLLFPRGSPLVDTAVTRPLADSTPLRPPPVLESGSRLTVTPPLTPLILPSRSPARTTRLRDRRKSLSSSSTCETKWPTIGTHKYSVLNSKMTHSAIDN